MDHRVAVGMLFSSSVSWTRNGTGIGGRGIGSARGGARKGAAGAGGRAGAAAGTGGAR